MIEPTILFEDDSLVVVDKPAGLVVHPGAGETGETLVDWLKNHAPEISSYNWPDPTRMGIVHRLDKDTSGVIVLAKNPDSLAALQQQFKDRSVQKIYYALVYGQPKDSVGTITTWIGRHPQRRQEQTVLPVQVGEAARREAISDYLVEKRLTLKGEKISLIRFTPKTGRMHQLRVQAKYLGTPILGDPIYTIKPAKRLSKTLGLNRQLLHAKELHVNHPVTQEKLIITSDFPADMDHFLVDSQADKPDNE